MSRTRSGKSPQQPKQIVLALKAAQPKPQDQPEAQPTPPAQHHSALERRVRKSQTNKESSNQNQFTIREWVANHKSSQDNVDHQSIRHTRPYQFWVENQDGLNLSVDLSEELSSARQINVNRLSTINEVGSSTDDE
ncbi:hypothetical protein Mgra_00002841 [Meloidogyne graminicola]|uniref:Uncharacterized protein n=1 Tax=Meloidogyne graminicola TaxID=189291 RepID=A0A8S9ZV57_9BILA|nr:hypothetical protein Mgra_00002841 [Meloidogyne graminicola]